MKFHICGDFHTTAVAVAARTTTSTNATTPMTLPTITFLLERLWSLCLLAEAVEKLIDDVVEDGCDWEVAGEWSVAGGVLCSAAVGGCGVQWE